MTHLHELAAFLDEFFQTSRFPRETSGILRDTTRPIRRVGLALEPGQASPPGPRRSGWTPCFCIGRRTWKRATLPEGVGVLAYHLPFDEKLMLGWNLRLADVLGLTAPEVIGWKQGRPLGMIGNVSSRSVADFYHLVSAIFGGREEARTCERNEVERVAVVGAMTEALVHEASERNADVYITGQLRQPGRVAMLDTGIGVIAVGHKRSEEWGLRALAHLLRERWAEMEVVVSPRLPSSGVHG